MKRSLLIALSSFGSIAFACPDFSGSYTCLGTEADDTEKVIVIQNQNEITTADSSGTTVFKLNGDFTIMADTLPVQAKGRCDNDNYVVNLAVPGLMSAEMKWSKTEAGYKIETSANREETSTMICVRK